MHRLTRVPLLLLILGVALASGAAETPELDENGQPYREPRGISEVSTLRPVVDPGVRSEATHLSEIQLLVYVRPTAEAASRTRASQIKQRHLPGIREISEQLREIERRNRPRASMSEDAELRQVRSYEMSLTEEDRELRLRLSEEMDSRMDAMHKEVGRVAESRADPGLNAVALEVEALGGRVDDRIPLVGALGVTLPVVALDELAGHPLVHSIRQNNFGAPDLDNSVETTGHVNWHTDPNTPYCGGAYDAGVVDSGVQENHPAFAGVTFYNDRPSPVDNDGHGTHVAGIIASAHATYGGTAPCLDALIWSNASGNPSTSMASFHAVASSMTQSPEVVNYSWGNGWADGLQHDYSDPPDGIIDDFGTDDTYDGTDQYFDSFVMNFDIMVTKSAGNNGWNDNVTTMTHPAPAYNILVVANMDDQDSPERDDDVRRGSSSVGPTLSGRRKPDITAPGTGIISTNAFWLGGGSGAGGNCTDPNVDNDFVTCSGTSMAAPHVNGGVLLMEDAGNHVPMAQKAVLLNTADWWTSNDTQTTADDGPVTSTSGPGSTDWDKSYGWGYLDMTEAFFNRGDYIVDSVVGRNDTNAEDDYKLYAGYMFVNEKSTLVWERRSDYLDAATPTTIYNLSDLNLRLYKEIDGILDDSDLDADDNVHQVASRDTTDYVIKVYSWSTSIDGLTSEPFALATEENFVEVPFPETFGRVIQRPHVVQPTQQFDFRYTLTNNSQIASHSNKLSLTMPAGWTLAGGSNPANAGTLGAGEQVEVTWTIQAPGVEQDNAPFLVQHEHDSYAEHYGPHDFNTTTDVVLDVTPPSPNPITWQINPAEISTSSIQMQASAASDAHGPVEYFFDFITSSTGGGNGSDSAWQQSAYYVDSALHANHRYCYRVRARDAALPTPNTTSYSSNDCDYTDIQTPSGITINAVTTTSIAARSTNYPSGLTRDSSGLLVQNMTRGTSSGWKQNNNDWYSTGLVPNTPYTFRAQARNGDASTTPLSPTLSRWTLAAQPAALPLSNATETSVQTHWSFNGNPAGTAYYVRNATTGAGSGWIANDHYTFGGLACGGTYRFEVRARNGEFVGTAWTDLGTVTIGLDSEGDGIPDCVDPDDDDDGALDGADCLPLDAGSWAVPGTVGTLALDEIAGETRLSWSAPSQPGAVSLWYDTVSSFDPADFDGADCVDSDGTDLETTIGAVPLVGETWYYLVVAENPCGSGSPGNDSSGEQRFLAACP